MSITTLHSTGELVNGNCPDYFIIGARGSGEKSIEAQDDVSNGRTIHSFVKTITQGLMARGRTVAYIPLTDSEYPAVTIDLGGFSDWSVGLVNVIQAGLGESYASLIPIPSLQSPFWGSVNRGASEMIAYVHDLHLLCPSSRYLLAGYSQGAGVVDMATAQMGNSDKSLIAGVALFGDLLFNNSDYNRDSPHLSANKGSWSSDTTGTYYGASGSHGLWRDILPGVPVVSHCHFQDPVCQGRYGIFIPGGTLLGASGIRYDKLFVTGQHTNYYAQDPYAADNLNNVDTIAAANELLEEIP
jgi:hypothetical protein